MMSHLRRYLFLQQLQLLVLLSATIEVGVRPRAHVRIINNLRPDLNLIIHCKSKNADVGTHLILYEQNFEVDFTLNFWGTTLYFCSMAWKYSLEYFYIYIQDRDQRLCKVYVWSIRATGLCMFNYKTGKYICYGWNPPLALN
ncbi:hypothetical protein ACFX13_013115 [Malus domestica]